MLSTSMTKFRAISLFWAVQRSKKHVKEMTSLTEMPFLTFPVVVRQKKLTFGFLRHNWSR